MFAPDAKKKEEEERKRSLTDVEKKGMKIKSYTSEGKPVYE
jgi:hypothetical protein